MLFFTPWSTTKRFTGVKRVFSRDASGEEQFRRGEGAIRDRGDQARRMLGKKVRNALADELRFRVICG